MRRIFEIFFYSVMKFNENVKQCLCKRITTKTIEVSFILVFFLVKFANNELFSRLAFETTTQQKKN